MSELLAPTRPAAGPSPAADPTLTLALNTPFVQTPEPIRVVDQAPGYVVLHEIARGGMGRVVAARDPGLGREVAIKFLLPTSDPSAAARFVREAEITARLPHPGVPPVHAIGRTPTGQPFLVMKLVRGRTLADLLATRPDPGHDLPRFVGVFEQVCQAVGYAHAQGIVHRDIKPANVMVGAFGEVQLMDWGLAFQKGDADPCPRPAGPAARGPHAPALTIAGTVLGTPGYMAPEQARGATIDARADVFALGAMLAAVLTGKQPIPDSTSLFSAAEDGIFAAAAVRDGLAGCGADPELAALAARCLDPDPAARPADGMAVADEIAAHRAGAETRARTAEADRAAAEARATAEAATRRAVEDRAAADRRARRARVGLVVAVAALVGLTAAVMWVNDRTAQDRRREREQADAGKAMLELERDRDRADAAAEKERADGERREARALVGQHLSHATDLGRRFRFGDAGKAIALAEALVERAGAADLRPDLARARAELATLAALDAARTKVLVWVSKGSHGAFADVHRDFHKAVGDAGFDPADVDLQPLSAKLKASPIRAELVAALDEWAAHEPDVVLKARAMELARLADPGPWTDRFRAPAGLADVPGCAKLAADADPAALTPAVLSALARRMMHLRIDPVPLLARAHAAHPSDFGLAFLLGDAISDRDPGRGVGYYRAARALRPDNFAVNTNLGFVLEKLGDTAGAAEAYRVAARIDPGSAMAQANLGRGEGFVRNWPAAAAAFRRAIALDPGSFGPYVELANARVAAGDPAGAEAAVLAGLAAAPGAPRLHERLADLRVAAGDKDGALAAYQAAVAAAPGDALAHTKLGGHFINTGRHEAGVAALRVAIKLDPRAVLAHQFMGIACNRRNDPAAAVGWFRTAVVLAPTDPEHYVRLAGALVNSDQVEEGKAELIAALRLAPRHGQAHQFMGAAHARKNDHRTAAGWFRKAAELNPDLVMIHFHLGTTLLQLGDAAGAVEPFREAARRYPGEPAMPTHLGMALAAVGRYSEAADAYRDALRRAPGFGPAVEGLARVEPLIPPVAPPPRPVERPRKID